MRWPSDDSLVHEVSRLPRQENIHKHSFTCCSLVCWHLCVCVFVCETWDTSWVIWDVVFLRNFGLIWNTTWPFSPLTHCQSCHDQREWFEGGREDREKTDGLMNHKITYWNTTTETALLTLMVNLFLKGCTCLGRHFCFNHDTLYVLVYVGALLVFVLMYC